MKKINLYMDEKGTQERLNISVPFSYKNKIKYADDRMTSYVGNILMIPEDKVKNIEKEYLKIVDDFLKQNHQLKNKSELKGQNILKGKNFRNGIASLKNSNLNFYIKLFKLLNKNKIENILFMVSKVSSIVSERISDFIYYCDEKDILPAYLFKYSVTKFINNDASEEFWKILVDKTKDAEEIIKALIYDINAFIERNLRNARTMGQNETLSQLTKQMEYALKSFKPQIKQKDIEFNLNSSLFDWALDLRITEKTYKGEIYEYDLYLDNGINKNIFKNSNIKNIFPENDSKQVIGIQISDNIVSIVGKLLSLINQDLKHDQNEITKIKNIRKEFFDLNEDHFELVKEMGDFLLNKDSIFHYVMDTFFDDFAIIWSFIQTISNWSTFEDFQSISSNDHADNFLKNYVFFMEQKITDMFITKQVEKETNKTLRQLVKEKLARPI